MKRGRPLQKLGLGLWAAIWEGSDLIGNENIEPLCLSLSTLCRITRGHYGKLSVATYTTSCAYVPSDGWIGGQIARKDQRIYFNVPNVGPHTGRLLKLTEGHALIGHSMKRTRFLDRCLLAGWLADWKTGLLNQIVGPSRPLGRLHQPARRRFSPIYIRASVTGCLRSPKSTRFHWTRETQRVRRKTQRYTQRIE